MIFCGQIDVTIEKIYFWESEKKGSFRIWPFIQPMGI